MFLIPLYLIASIAIGLFLLSLLLTSRKANPQATYLFSALLIVLVAGNFDNWLTASGSWRSVPLLSGFSRASILLVGPLIYLYARSAISQQFRLSKGHLWHLLPYLVAYATLVPTLYLRGREFKLAYVSYSLSNQAPLDLSTSLILIAYLVHLAIYLSSTLRFISRERRSSTHAGLVVPAGDRLRWLGRLTAIFAIYLSMLSALIIWAVGSGVYRSEINLCLTLTYSIVIYYLGVCIVRNERLILPGFARKYETLNAVDQQRDSHLARLSELMEVGRLYLDPDLTLGKTAASMGIPPGYLSRLVNEEHGRNFPDFINALRIEEFKCRLKDPANDQLSLLGIATEVGFSSKSSFNSAFKKLTGMTPSDFKNSQNLIP